MKRYKKITIQKEDREYIRLINSIADEVIDEVDKYCYVSKDHKMIPEKDLIVEISVRQKQNKNQGDENASNR